MINECVHDIHDKPELDSYFNQLSPNNMPALIICGDKLKQQNEDIQNYNLLNNEESGCILPINVRNQTNSTGLQKGYSKNIDVESELKRINFYNDKCFKDNYKVNPNNFECHTNFIKNNKM